MNSDLFEGNLQLIESLLDAISLISENNVYIVEVANVYLKLLQLLSVTTWKRYPFQIGKLILIHQLIFQSKKLKFIS